MTLLRCSRVAPLCLDQSLYHHVTARVREEEARFLSFLTRKFAPHLRVRGELRGVACGQLPDLERRLQRLLRDHVWSTRVRNHALVTPPRPANAYAHQLALCTRADLDSLSNFGEKAIQQCRDAMTAVGFEHPDW
jgi:hypothetical protein